MELFSAVGSFQVNVNFLQFLVEQLIYIALWGLGLAVILAIWANILYRIGFSKWYALIFLIPGWNIIAFIVVVAKQWPIEREMARLRLLAGESKDIEADVESVISLAITLEQKRQWDRIPSLYRLAEEKSQNPQTKQYIGECIQRLVGRQP